MPVSIQIQNRNELELQLQRAVSVLNDQTELWDTVIRNVLVPRIRQAFTSEGGGRWQPRQDNLPHPLLRKSGALFRSLVQPGARGNVDIRSPHSLNTERILHMPIITSSVRLGSLPDPICSSLWRTDLRAS